MSVQVELEQRMQELSFAQAQISAIFENSALGIGTAALDGTILSANPALARIFGYDEEEILQIHVDDFFPDRDIRHAITQELLRERIAKVPRLQLQRKDGTIIHVNLTESLLTRENQDVLLGVVDDITDQVLAEQALQEQAQAAAVAAERARIAGELHDSVTQTLYTTSLIAEALPKVWHTHPEEALERLEELRRLTQGALAEMRALLLELRPGAFAERDLGDLLRQLTDAMAGRTEIPIATTIIGSCKLPIEVRIAFYRIAQEALNNISKHARASRAAVSLTCQGDHTLLKVSDNGRGFDPQFSQPDELGLAIMRERSQEIGADFSIHSKKDKGTEIVVRWSPTASERISNG